MSEQDIQQEYFARICAFLDEHDISYRTVHHEVTLTSEESARARGEDISIGGKALLMKVGKTFRLFVISAVLRSDSKAIRQYFGEKKLRFASKEELTELTHGLVPGCVPPFGEPVLPFALYIDESITKNDKIAFNAGSLTDSVIMSVEDYLRISNGTVFRFGSTE